MLDISAMAFQAYAAAATAAVDVCERSIPGE